MRSRVRWLAFAVLLGLMGGAAVPLSLRAAPMTRHVTTCSGDATASGSLGFQIAAAQAGDTVVFDQDCSDTTNTPITPTATLLIPNTKNLTIDALAGTARTVIVDGGGTIALLRLQALNNAGPTMTLNGLTLRNGKATQGGAIFNDQGTLTITNSAILTNTATVSGGGIENAGGMLTVTNSTLSGNKVTGTTGATGGAIDNNAFGKVQIISSTITGNMVSSAAAQSAAGGGLFDFQNTANTVTLTDTIIAGNTPGNCNSADIGSVNTYGLTSGGHNLIGKQHNDGTDPVCGQDFSGISNGPNNDLVGTDANPIQALFGPIGTYTGHTATLPLLPGSPAIDAGGAACPTGVSTDQRGKPRPVNGQCDIGAFESGGFTLTISGNANPFALINTAFAQPLAVTVAAKGMGEPVAGGIVTFAATPMGGATATLAGTPATITAGGQASVTATANGTTGAYPVAANATGATGATFTLTNVTSPMVAPATLPAGTTGTAYSATVSATGGTGTGYTFALSGGTMLPAGLMLNATTGAITGTPTSANTFMFTITVTDSGGFTGSKMYTVTIANGTPMLIGLTTTAPTNTGSGNRGTAGMPVIAPGGSLTLNTMGSYSNNTMGAVSGLTYTSSDPNTVTVNMNGTITGIAPTTMPVTITITAPNNVKTTITITVTTATGGSLMNPNPQPMAHATAPASASVVPAPQPGLKPTAMPTGPQPQTSAPTATPQAQPGRH